MYRGTSREFLEAVRYVFVAWRKVKRGLWWGRSRLNWRMGWTRPTWTQVEGSKVEQSIYFDWHTCERMLRKQSTQFLLYSWHTEGQRHTSKPNGYNNCCFSYLPLASYGLKSQHCDFTNCSKTQECLDFMTQYRQHWHHSTSLSAQNVSSSALRLSNNKLASLFPIPDGPTILILEDAYLVPLCLI